MTSKTLRMKSLGTNEGLRRDILPWDGAGRPVARPLANPPWCEKGEKPVVPKGAHMDFSAQLDTLKKRVDDTVATVKAAATENREQLKQRIDKAQVDANLALKDVEEKAGQAGDKAQSKWAQAKADAAVKMADIKAKAERRQSQMDSDITAADAQSAESDADAAIDFANWAVDNARGAILDALDAAAYSVKLAEKAMS
jgi:hypothetical protein